MKRTIRPNPKQLIDSLTIDRRAVLQSLYHQIDEDGKRLEEFRIRLAHMYGCLEGVIGTENAEEILREGIALAEMTRVEG